MKREKECLQCGKVFSIKRKVSANVWNEIKFCSRNCYYKNRTGTHKLDKVCIICKKDYQCWPYQKNNKCCSAQCSKLYHQTPEYRNAFSKKCKGRVISLETRQKISLAQKGKRTGEENHLWKGNDVGYRAIHEWVIREKGKPDKCEHCGLGSADNKRLVWANKSHHYLRDVNDWIRLCYLCHRKFDFPFEKHP